MGDFSFSGGAKFSGIKSSSSSSSSSGSWAGKTFTIGGGSGSGSKLTTPDKIVKPGLSDDVLQRLALMRPPVVNGVANIRWGKPAKFQITEPDTADQITYTTTTVNLSSDSEVDVPDDVVVYDFSEYGRAIRKVRIENPDDSEQWVEVEVIDCIVFTGPDGNYWRYTLRNDPS